MFNLDRFNLSRFSLGDDGSIYPIEVTFADTLNAVAGVAIPVETTAFFNDVFRGSMRGAIAVKSTFSSDSGLAARCSMQANILTYLDFAANLLPQITGSQNSCIVSNLHDRFGASVWAGKDIPWDLTSEDHLRQNVVGVKDILTSAFLYGVFTTVAGAIKQSTEVASFKVTVPPGAELRIDSDTFRVTLAGENILHLQSGEWINLSRELLYLDIESASGGDLQGTLIYTERYL